LDRRGIPRDPEPRVASRQELQASSQDDPWKGGGDRSPALAGVATGAGSQDALEQERNAETGWLISVGTDLRSFLGIAALLVFVLPAVVLVLTLMGADNKPVSMNTPTARGGGSAITRQSQPGGGERSGDREGGNRLPGRHDRSPGTVSEGDGVGPTSQTGRDQRSSHQVQDTSVAAAPATPTAAAAGSPEPVSSVAASSAPISSVAASSAPATGPVEGSGETPTPSTPSVPQDTSTAPTTATQPASATAQSAPPLAQQASSLDPSASAIARGMPATGEASAEDFQGVIPDASYPSGYDGGSLR
jgi:hypothetical protein